MSVPSGDYVNYTSGGGSCSYNTLGNYTDGYSMNVAPQGKIVSGHYIVPTWDPISYDSLTGSVPTCNGYYDIKNAYGKGAGNCQPTFLRSLCGSKQ